MESQYSICIDGIDCIQGDHTSIAVAFNNLTGESFLKDQPWLRGSSYDNYLDKLSYMLDVELSPGKRIDLVQCSSASVLKTHFLFHDAPGCFLSDRGAYLSNPQNT